MNVLLKCLHIDCRVRIFYSVIVLLFLHLAGVDISNNPADTTV